MMSLFIRNNKTTDIRLKLNYLYIIRFANCISIITNSLPHLFVSLYCIVKKNAISKRSNFPFPTIIYRNDSTKENHIPIMGISVYTRSSIKKYQIAKPITIIVESFMPNDMAFKICICFATRFMFCVRDTQNTVKQP